MDFIPHSKSLAGTHPTATARAQDERPTREVIAEAITAFKNDVAPDPTLHQLARSSAHRPSPLSNLVHYQFLLIFLLISQVSYANPRSTIIIHLVRKPKITCSPHVPFIQPSGSQHLAPFHRNIPRPVSFIPNPRCIFCPLQDPTTLLVTPQSSILYKNLN